MAYEIEGSAKNSFYVSEREGRRRRNKQTGRGNKTNGWKNESGQTIEIKALRFLKEKEGQDNRDKEEEK